MHLDAVAKKLMGVTGAGENGKNPRFKNFEFGLGTPPPLETSAARSHNRLSLLESSRKSLEENNTDYNFFHDTS